MNNKICKHCANIKSIFEFNICKINKIGEKIYQSNCKICQAKLKKIHYENNRDKYIEKAKNSNLLARLQCLKYYSNGKLICQCCKENNIEFLCIDHINGGGTKHRNEIGKGTHIYNYLIKNNFPLGYRVLCSNCNHSFGVYGYCPHQKCQETKIC